MKAQFLKPTALAALIHDHGWVQVETPPGPTPVLRSVVYVDGDVTTKVFGGPHVDALTVAAHFDAIDRLASAVSTRVRRMVRSTYLALMLIAAATALWVRDWPDSAVLAAALLLPLVVDLVRSHFQRLLVVTPQISAVGSAIGVLVFATWSDSDALRHAAWVTVACNLGLALVLWILAWRLRRLFRGLKSSAIQEGS